MHGKVSFFSKTAWHDFSDWTLEQLRKEVSAYDGNKLLNTPVDSLCDYLATKYSFEPPTLQTDGILIDQRESQVDVSNKFSYLNRGNEPHEVLGQTVEVTIPFTGDAEGFYIRPSTRLMVSLVGTISDNTLIMEVTGVNLNAVDVKATIKQWIEHIETNLKHLQKDAASFDDRIRSEAKVQVMTRREKLLANQSLVASLGFNLKTNPNSPTTYTAPNIRRKLPPVAPVASSAPYQPEPCLPSEEYNHILDVIERMAHVMERSPAAFVKMDEETLRTHILVHLNGHYEGQATGETFNFKGKTDILIRVHDKNIFIGECKFWGGAKVLTETIDQVLGYSSWRDTKVSVILFNRNKDTSKVLAAAKEATAAHPNFKRFLGDRNETSFQYQFSHKHDQSREMIVTIMVFDVPRA